jgi:cation transport ATPase
VNTLARFISVIFHPLLIPTYLFLLFAFAFPAGLDPIPPDSQNVFIILIFIVTFALPALNVAILKTFGSIRSYQMTTRQERVFPFILIAVIYVAITWLFYWKSRIGLNDNFMRIMIIMDLLVILATLITFFYKISIHSMAVWGVVGILIPLNKMTEVNALFFPALAVVVLAGFVMSSRLVLQVHSLKEVMWGAIAGLAGSVAGMMLLF